MLPSDQSAHALPLHALLGRVGASEGGLTRLSHAAHGNGLSRQRAQSILLLEGAAFTFMEEANP